ncbi:MAG: DUF3105 domain-containing protein [Acidimicrobiales bacterium]
MPRLRSPRSTLLVAGLAVAVALGACTAAGGVDDRPLTATIVAVGAIDEGIDGVDAFRIESNEHTLGEVTYPVHPPPGGPHHPLYANCGFYDVPIADEHVVHDLEHGVVWLAYSPALPPADVEVIHDLARVHKVVATLYRDLPVGAAVVASAWARQLIADTVDDQRLRQFVVQYEDGSQAPEAGGACTGSSIGEPIP